MQLLTVQAQSKSDIWFRNYGLKEGLPAKKINDITQGPDGFIWLATLDGLVRYDGYEFQPYRIPPKNGFPSGNFTDRVFHDGQGKIWVGFFYSHYIGYYDTQTHSFHTINLAEKIGIEQESRTVRLLGVDADKNVWVSYYLNQKSAILLSIDGEDLSIKSYTDPEDQIYPIADLFADHVPYSSFHLDKNQSIWMGTSNGLLHQTEQDSLVQFKGDSTGIYQPKIHSIKDRGQELWLATDQGLLSFDKARRAFEQVSAPEYLQEQELVQLYEDLDGTLWITSMERTYWYKDGSFQRVNRSSLQSLNGPSMIPQAESDRYLWFINNRVYEGGVPVTNGITRYDKRSDAFQVFASNDISGLGNIQYINRLFIDASGSLWVGNNYEGLSQYPPLFKKFETHFRSPKFQDRVGNSFYFRAKTSPQGHYVAGTGNGYIFIKHAQTGEEKVLVEFAPPEESQGRNLMSELMFLGPGELLVATQFNGLKKINYDPESLDVTNIQTWSMDEIGIGRLSNLIHDDEGNLWIGGLGVAKADLETGTFETYYAPEEFDPRYDFGLFSEKDSQGNLWFYSFNYNAIKRFNPETKKLNLYNYADSLSQKLKFRYVPTRMETFAGDQLVAANDNLYILNEEKDQFELLFDEELPEPIDIDQTTPGEIIVTTFSHGVFVIDMESKEIIERITAEDGLGSDQISDLMIASDGHYWMLTALGLSRYNPESGDITNYYTDQGLQPSESETSYHFFTSDSSTYFPVWIGNTGLVSFQPSQLPTNTYSHAPVFTNVHSQEQSLSLSGEVNIPYDQNTISLTYSNLGFQYPEKSEYRYKINGEEWSQWENSYEAQFAQLAPGTYTFKVQARNADRVIADQVATYTFTVNPPWYMSTTAYLLYVLFGLGGIGLAAVWYSNYRTEQRAIRMRAEQAEELAKLDRMKTNLLTNISHELRTPLTLILGPIDQLRTKAEELGEDWKRRIQIASRNGRRLQQLVEQVLDLTRLDAKQLELELANMELNAFLRRLTESFESMAEQHEVDIQIDLPDQPISMQADPDKLEKAMVNLLSNAIKFTPSGGSIRLATEADDAQVTISVADTGRGISPERLPHIFDRFHSTSEQISGGGKGLGVGLAITKEFIEMHEGTISVESEEGSGTTFTITLPVTEHDESLPSHAMVDEERVSEDPVSENGAPATPAKVDLYEKSFTVMVVEDNQDMRTYIADLLGNGELKVETVSNGLEAKKQLAIIEPDVIISDIMMPEMDGFALAEYVRSQDDYRLTPMVLLSARAEVDDRIRGFELGISDYLVKPFNESELKARVQNLLYLKSEREKYAQENGEQDASDAMVEESVPSTLQKELQAYVEANLSESKITVEELSAEVNLSRRQLYRNLKAETGFTPAEFIREIRLHNARRMLENGSKQTISEVAYAVGFNTPSYFSKLFKKRYGRSPSEYS
jgi:signal transduction histidine kinase/DNA-binding response OmpR family regulator/streptogramin lyase